MRATACRGLLVGIAVAVTALAAACSGPQPRTLPPPSSTSSTDPEPSTTTVDLSQQSLESVPGETTTTLRATGDVVLLGVVGGPEGALPGAVVRIDRLVGDAVQTVEVGTDEDGTWRREDLPGGRFRVRAYRPPDLTMTEPEVFYLPDGDTRELSLRVRTFEGLDVIGGVTPPAPMVGDAVNLAVRVVERFVDEDGIGRTRPMRSIRVRVRSSGWREREEPLGFTDEDGTVVFGFECDRVAPVTATAIVGQDRETFRLEVPDCRPEPTTTTSATTTTESTGSTTSTSSSTSSTSSTTTEPTTSTTEGE